MLTVSVQEREASYKTSECDIFQRPCKSLVLTRGINKYILWASGRSLAENHAEFMASFIRKQHYQECFFLQSWLFKVLKKHTSLKKTSWNYLFLSFMFLFLMNTTPLVKWHPNPSPILNVIIMGPIQSPTSSKAFPDLYNPYHRG